MLHGPAPRWPAAVDRALERWARLGPVPRLGVGALAALALLTAAVLPGLAAGEDHGRPVQVVVAGADLEVGRALDADDVRVERRPADLVPARPASPERVDAAVDASQRLAMAVPRGAVLTEAHLSPQGPAAGLAGAQRAVPVPLGDGPVPSAPGWAEVWLVVGDGRSERLAGARPVLAVERRDQTAVALLGLHAEEVGAVLGRLAAGQAVLVDAPAP